MTVSARAVVGASLRFLVVHHRALLALAAPYLLASAWMAAIGATSEEGTVRPLVLIPFVLGTWLALPLAVNTHRAVLEGPRPQPIPLGTLFRVGVAEMKFLLPALVVALAAGTGLGALMGGLSSGSLLGLVMGLPPFALGLWVAVRLNPAMAAGALGVKGAWSLGWRLSRGRFWPVLRTLALAVGVIMLASLVLALPFLALGVAAAELDLDPYALPLAILLPASFYQAAVQTATTLFLYAVSATLFHRLRETAPAEEMAA